TYTTYEQMYPSVAMDADGDFVIVWMSYDQDGSYGGIYAQMYDSSGSAVDSEFQVNTYTYNSQDRPSVAMDAYGDFVITWESYGQDGSHWGIYAQMYGTTFSLKSGALDELNAIYPTGDEKVDEILAEAAVNIEKSLDSDLWVDGTHLDVKHGYRVFDEEKNAVKDLLNIKLDECEEAKYKGIISLTLNYTGGDDVTVNEGIVMDNGDGTYTITPTTDETKLTSKIEVYINGTLVSEIHINDKIKECNPHPHAVTPEVLEEVQNVIDKLVEVDEMLATTAVQDAVNTPVEDPENQDQVDKDIAEAEEELAKAEEELGLGNPDKAIDHYKKAWENAQEAIKHAQK
ncbi:hypothetical protein ACFLY8_04785, partial [Halobacteriota archaeon]